MRVQLASGPVAKPAAILPLANLGFSIPAGASDYTSELTLARDRPSALVAIDEDLQPPASDGPLTVSRVSYCSGRNVQSGQR